MSDNGSLMAGKKGLIMGVANDRSIGWAIARAVHEQGGELAFTYQGDALRKRVEPLAGSVGSDLVLPCDVTDTASVEDVFPPYPGAGESSILSCMPSPFRTRRS